VRRWIDDQLLVLRELIAAVEIGIRDGRDETTLAAAASPKVAGTELGAVRPV